jgi:hypothetical protein
MRGLTGTSVGDGATFGLHVNGNMLVLTISHQASRAALDRENFVL